MQRSFAKLASNGRKSSSIDERKWIRVGAVALRAICSSHMAAWPSKVVSRVNPSNAAAASKRRPTEVVVKVLTSFANQFHRVLVALGKMEWRGSHVGQVVNLRQKASCSLNRIMCRRIAARERSRDADEPRAQNRR